MPSLVWVRAVARMGNWLRSNLSRHSPLYAKCSPIAEAGILYLAFLGWLRYDGICCSILASNLWVVFPTYWLPHRHMICNIFLNNGYPTKIVNRAMNNTLNPYPRASGSQLCPVYLKLPWIGSGKS